MSAEVDTFLDSLKADTPPTAAASLLRAVWHGLRGDWEAAHQIAQDDTSAEGSWVHAWLHRIKGDLDNARYWYRRASASRHYVDCGGESLYPEYLPGVFSPSGERQTGIADGKVDVAGR